MWEVSRGRPFPTANRVKKADHVPSDRVCCAQFLSRARSWLVRNLSSLAGAGEGRVGPVVDRFAGIPDEWQDSPARMDLFTVSALLENEQSQDCRGRGDGNALPGSRHST